MAETNRKLTLELEVKPPQPGHGFDQVARDAQDAMRRVQDEVRRATPTYAGGPASPASGGQAAVVDAALLNRSLAAMAQHAEMVTKALGNLGKMMELTARAHAAAQQQITPSPAELAARAAAKQAEADRAGFFATNQGSGHRFIDAWHQSHQRQESGGGGLGSMAGQFSQFVAPLLQLTRGLAVMGVQSGKADELVGQFVKISSWMDTIAGGLGSVQRIGSTVGGVLGGIFGSGSENPDGLRVDGVVRTGGFGATGEEGNLLDAYTGGIKRKGLDFVKRAGGGLLRRFGAGALGFGGAVLGGLGAAIALNSSETAQNWAAERAPNWMLNFGNRWSNMWRGHGFTDREGDRGVVNLAQSNADLAAAQSRRSFFSAMNPAADALAGAAGLSSDPAVRPLTRDDFTRSSGRRVAASTLSRADRTRANEMARRLGITLRDNSQVDMAQLETLDRTHSLIRREDEAARMGAVRAPWEARQRELDWQQTDLLGQERGIDIEVTGALADRSFGRTQSEFQRLMGRGMAADASASDRAAYQSSFAEMERQFGDMRTGSGATRAAVMRANMMVGEAVGQRSAARSRMEGATTEADRARYANELVQAQERVTQATQQQVQANRQLREAEIGRLENYRQLVAQAHNLARANADSYRRQTRQQAIGLALGGQDMQENALHISQRLRQVVDSGQGELTQDELAFAQGNEMFRPLLERYGERMAAGNPYIAEIQRNLGRPEEQARLDTEAGRLGTRERELNDRIGRAMEDNARDFQRDLQDALRPEMENMGRMLALGLTASLREHTFRTATEVARAEIARAMAGFGGA